MIIAAYQAAPLIGRALDSLLGQTLPPHEIIVCDDGSTDDIESALRPYRDKIVFLRREHGGEAAAKNAAARAASGDFLAILDADDAYLPYRLEALATLARARPDLDILTTDAYLELAGEPIRRCYTDGWTFEVRDQRRTILERNFVFGHAAVRRQRFLAAGGFDESIRWTTDWECWIRLILDGARVGCVSEPLAIYHIHEGGLSARRTNLVAGRIQTLEKTAARSDLSTEERDTVERSLERHRRELALLELREALRDGRDDARSRAVAVARNSQYPVRVRLSAVAAASLPGLAARRERRRYREGWLGAGGTYVARS